MDMSVVLGMFLSIPCNCGFLAYVWFFWPIIAAITGIFLVIVFKPSKKTKKILILGMMGAGKTTLWRWLRGEKPKKTDHYIPTGNQKCESFVVEGSNGRKVTIETTRDFGGGSLHVSEYEEYIKEGTFMYYLIDLSKFDRDIQGINARLYNISYVIKKNKMEYGGLKVLITHLEETKFSKNEAVEYVKKNLHKRIDTKNIMAVNLYDEADINLIKNEIIDAEIEIIK